MIVFQVAFSTLIASGTNFPIHFHMQTSWLLSYALQEKDEEEHGQNVEIFF